MKSRSRRGVSTTVVIGAAVIIIVLIVAGIYVYYPTLVPTGTKDTLIMGTTDSVESGLDPALAYDYFGWEIILATGSGLVDIKPGTPKGASADDIIPALALNWSSTSDGLHWTFNLR